MEPLGDEVRRELGRFGAQGTMAEVVEVWPAAVGAEIARSAWPARFQRDGTLVVHVRDAIWGFELTQRAAEISGRLPGRPKLRFVPGELPEAPPDPPPPTPAAATPEQAREAASLAAAIDDPNLRESVAKVIKAALVRASDDRSV